MGKERGSKKKVGGKHVDIGQKRLGCKGKRVENKILTRTHRLEELRKSTRTLAQHRALGRKL